MIDLAFATIDNGPYATHLGRCGLDVIVKRTDVAPATIYNRILDETKERYVCFIHSDCTCMGLERAIEHTIALRPGCLLGAVGVDANHNYLWSMEGVAFNLMTADSCCLVVDKEMGLRFDDKTFDGYHLYVEDMCMQAGKVSTIFINSGDSLYRPIVESGPHLIHHSYTVRQRGAAWGDYWKYRALLEKKWPGVQTT